MIDRRQDVFFAVANFGNTYLVLAFHLTADRTTNRTSTTINAVQPQWSLEYGVQMQLLQVELDTRDREYEIACVEMTG